MYNHEIPTDQNIANSAQRRGAENNQTTTAVQTPANDAGNGVSIRSNVTAFSLARVVAYR